MGRVLPWLTRPAGGFLVLFNSRMIVSLVVHLWIRAEEVDNPREAAGGSH